MEIQNEHKAVQLMCFNRHDPAAACRLGRVPTPRAGPGQVVVKLLCRPVNPADIMCLRGFYPTWKPASFPSVPGLEGMGVVCEVGENVKGLLVGQRVCPILEWGDPETWQEYMLCSAELTIPIPDSISNEVAAQFFVNPFSGSSDLTRKIARCCVSVYALVEELDVPVGEYIIQTGASSVLGRMFIQYARYRGLKTINLVRKDEQKEELKKLGGDIVINYTQENAAKEVKSLTSNKLAYAGLDCLGGDATKILCSCVRNNASVIVYGTMSKVDVHVGGADLLLRGINVRGFYLKHWIYRRGMKHFHDLCGIITDLLAKRIMEPPVGQKFALENFAEAIKESRSRTYPGKVLLVSD